MSEYERVYQLTDGCMWEANKQSGTMAPHSVEVVDVETGQIRYIKGGSKIRFLEGDITEVRTQEQYNAEQEWLDAKNKKNKKVLANGKDNVHKGGSRQKQRPAKSENGK